MENEIKQKSVGDCIAKLLSNLEGKGLTSLEGSPEEVGHFNVSLNNLKNLIGSPKKVESYYANDNQLETLEGAPEEVRHFNVSHNQLKNLIGSPKKVESYYAFNNQLETLEGSPEEVGHFDVSHNQLKNLIGSPKKVESYYANDNQLETLEGAPEEVEYFYISHNPTLKNTNGIPKRIGTLDLDGTIHSASQFTEYPEYVEKIYFDKEIPIEDIKEIVSNIKEVQYVYILDKNIYIRDEKYTKDEILKMNKQTR